MMRLTRQLREIVEGKRSSWLVCFLAFVLITGNVPAVAADSVLSQVNLGLLAHDMPILGPQKEHGIDVNGELLFVSPVPDRWVSGVAPNWRWLLQPRPTFGVEANTNGYTSQVYGSLTWTVDLDTRGVLWPDRAVFLSVSFGPAYNTGHVSSLAGNRLSLGSNLLFHTGLEVGWRIIPAFSLSAYFDHSSNAGLARENEGLDNVGVRCGLHF